MIPTVFLLGVVVGRWWFVPATGLAWVALLMLVGDLGVSDAPIAAALAMANAAVGVACRKVAALSLNRVRRRTA